jgi:hypothetical protein
MTHAHVEFICDNPKHPKLIKYKNGYPTIMELEQQLITYNWYQQTFGIKGKAAPEWFDRFFYDSMLGDDGLGFNKDGFSFTKLGRGKWDGVYDIPHEIKHAIDPILFPLHDDDPVPVAVPVAIPVDPRVVRGPRAPAALALADRPGLLRILDR